MNANIEKAMKELAKNEELCQKFSEAQELGEKYEIIKPFSEGLSLEDFKKEFSAHFMVSLSDDDLSDVAGGFSNNLNDKAQKIITKISAAGTLISTMATMSGLPENKITNAIQSSIQTLSVELEDATTITQVAAAVASAIIIGLEKGGIKGASKYQPIIKSVLTLFPNLIQVDN